MKAIDIYLFPASATTFYTRYDYVFNYAMNKINKINKKNIRESNKKILNIINWNYYKNNI